MVWWRCQTTVGQHLSFQCLRGHEAEIEQERTRARENGVRHKVGKESFGQVKKIEGMKIRTTLDTNELKQTSGAYIVREFCGRQKRENHINKMQTKLDRKQEMGQTMARNASKYSVQKVSDIEKEIGQTQNKKSVRH